MTDAIWAVTSVAMIILAVSLWFGYDPRRNRPRVRRWWRRGK